MATSTEHYERAAQYAAALDTMRQRRATTDEHSGHTFEQYAAAGQLHAMLAQVTLAYEDRAGYTSEDRWEGPNGKVYTEAEALAAGATWGDYQHADGTVDKNVLILGGEPMGWDERSVPANSYARALAAKL